MNDVWWGVGLVAVGFIAGGMAALARVRRGYTRDEELIHCRIALCTARSSARVIVAMIQDEDYVTARHCAVSMYDLGEE